MDGTNHPDPLTEAASRAGERTVQAVSLLATGGQKLVQLREYLRENKLRKIAAERHRARMTWAPAHDPRWLNTAGLLDVARIWGAAMPYADRGARWYDPTAASAMAKCEARLRTLHPYAMARYDRLRADGAGAADAMRQAAPLFTAPPTVHTAGPAHRPAGLTAAEPGTIPERGATFTLAEHGPGKEEFLAIRRGQAIAAGLREGATEDGRSLARGDARMHLEERTNLSDKIITHAVDGIPEGPRAGDVALQRSLHQRLLTAERARAADLDTAIDNPVTPEDERADRLVDARRQAAYADGLSGRSPARLAARDFPFTIHQVLSATGTPSNDTNVRARARVNAPASRRPRASGP